MKTHDRADGEMLETEKIAKENPQAVLDFAERVDDPLKSALQRIVNRVQHD